MLKKSDFKDEEFPFIAGLWNLLTKIDWIIENNRNNKKDAFWNSGLLLNL